MQRLDERLDDDLVDLGDAITETKGGDPPLMLDFPDFRSQPTGLSRD